MAVVWSGQVRTRHVNALEQHNIDTIGRMLADQFSHLLETDNLIAMRRQVISSAQQHGLVDCRVVDDRGQVLAAIDPSLTSLDSEGDRNHVSEQMFVDDEIVNTVVPVMINDRQVAQLTIARPAYAQGIATWQAPAVIWASCIITLASLLLLYRRVRDRLGTATLIREALIGLSRDDANMTIAHLGEELGEVAVAWNSLLSQLEADDQTRIENRLSHAMQRTEEPSANLQNACDAMSDGLILLDENNCIAYVNGAAAIFLGLERAGIAGQQLEDIQSSNDIADACVTVMNKKRSGRGIMELDRRGNGGQGVLRIVARPVRHADEVASIIIIQDITQQRVAHESHNAFLAQAAHELRTPLTNIRLHIEAAIDCGEDESTMRNDCHNVINSEALRLERIVGDMLSVAEIEAGSLLLNEDDVHMETILKALEKDHAAHAKAKGLSLKFHLPPKMPRVRGDQDKVLLALHNLVGNAIKYTEAGGSVTVEVDAADEQVVIRVVDTGYGIKEEEQHRVFDKFYRAEDARVRKVTGSGLGLPLARELVRMHGGDITIESEYGEGCTFTMTLPVVDIEAVV